MAETLELPNGDVVSPDEVLLHDGYPFRYVPLDDDQYAFAFSPLYWGDSGMDIPFPDREALSDQWSDESRGTLTPTEWEAWLQDARADDRFDDTEVDALAEELPVDANEVSRENVTDGFGTSGVIGRIRSILGR